MKKITREFLRKEVKKEATSELTLDIGCGDSPYSNFFPNKIGIDVVKYPKVDVVADAHYLPFKNESFSCVLCTEVLEHLRDSRLAISEMNRVLKKDSKLILSTRFIFPLHQEPEDYWRFTEHGLKELLKSWKIKKLSKDFSNITTLAVLTQRLAFTSNNIFGKIAFHSLTFIFRFLSPLLDRLNKSKLMCSGYFIVAKKR
jgi:SAM-dependent methyltransferase